MPIETPNTNQHEGPAAMASRYVDVAELPWVPTRFPGVDLKVLMTDKDTGISTALTRFAPGAELPLHEHVGLEQSWILEGSLVDDEGVAKAGNYVWRPGGSRHSAHAPNGCLALTIFMKPNRFHDEDPWS